MRRATLRRRRSGAQRAVLLAFALVVLVAGGVAAGLTAYLAAVADAGVRTSVTESPRDEVAAQISAQGGEDPLAENAAVTEHVAALLPGVPYELYRSRVFGPRTLNAGPDGAPDSDDSASRLTRAVFASYQELPDHADLVDGQWPGDDSGATGTDPVPVAVHAGSAEDLGIGVGDPLSIPQQAEGIAMQVTGLYLPREPDAPYWYGSVREVDGSAPGTGLVVVLDDADLDRAAATASTGATVTTRWRLAPVRSELQAEHVATLESALPRIVPRLSGDARLAESRISFDDRLGDLLRESGERLQAARSAAAAPLVLLALASVVSLTLVGRLLAAVREPETALLRSRGASAALLVRWTVREALPLGVLPAALGGAIAWWLLRQHPDLGPMVEPPAVLAGAAAAAVLAAAMLTGHGVRASRAETQTTIQRRAGETRRRAAVGAGTGMLVVAAAAVTGWQWRRYGGPTVDDPSGASRIDPFAVAAPAAALLAGGVLAAVVVPRVAWAAARLVGRLRGLTGALAVRHVARRPGAHALPVALVAVAAGGGTLAAGFTGTWTDLQAAAAAQRTGADLQVLLRPGSLHASAATTNDIDFGRYREIAGVRRVEPVTQVPRANIGDGTVTILAEPSEVPDVPAGVQLPPAEGVELVVEAAARGEVDRELTATLGLDTEEEDIEPAAAPVEVALWVVDADGVVSLLEGEPIEVPPDGEPALYTVGAELPPGTPPWRVVGAEFEVTVPRPPDLPMQAWRYDYDIAATALRTTPGAEELDVAGAADWTTSTLDSGAQPMSDEFAVEQSPSGAGLRIDSGGDRWTGRVRARLLPGPQRTAPLRVVASEQALDRFGLAVGDEASVRLLGTDLPVEIVDATQVVAGTAAAEVITADRAELTATLLGSWGRPPAVNEIWIDTTGSAADDGSAAAATEEITAEVADSRAEVLDRVALRDELLDDVFARVAVVTIWVTAAASVLLAGAGLAAAAAVAARQRDPEVPVLRAVGCSPGQQARARLRELALTTVLALGIGAGTGWLAVQLSADLLALATTFSPVEILQPTLRMAVGPLAGSLGALAAVGLVVAAGHAASVRRRASLRPARQGVR